MADIDPLRSLTPHHRLFLLPLTPSTGGSRGSESFLRGSFKTGSHYAFQAILELTL